MGSFPEMHVVVKCKLVAENLNAVLLDGRPEHAPEALARHLWNRLEELHPFLG